MAGLSVEAPPSAGRADQRIVALDGLRGLMTIVVVLSHFFAEVPHGIGAFAMGWIAVIVFFVLSGFLIGRLILEKMHCSNFLTVFYIRRILRTLPVYVVCCTIVYGFLTYHAGQPWVASEVVFPFWSYLTFTQNFYMVHANHIGAHWLAPTWTLAVEEHFYLLGPALFFVIARRWLVWVLAALMLASLAARGVIFYGGFEPMIALSLLPFMAFTILAGLIAAVLLKTPGINWEEYDFTLRVVPIAALFACAGLLMVDGGSGSHFRTFGPFVISLGSASFMMAIARGAPEANRLESPFLCFFGTTSYSVYLTHLMVLGLMHGVILGTRPDLGTPAQYAVTVAALPVTVLVGWVVTRLVEAPISAYGRSFKWRMDRPADGLANRGAHLAGNR
jgi:peptidoglycan/LPS O-acetylase OafA/YrhL